MISIAVMTTLSKKKYRDQTKACRATWGQIAAQHQIPVVNYIGDYVHPDFPGTVSLTGVGETYQSAFDKQFGGLHDIMTRHPAKFYLIVGTDNYVVLPQLLQQLADYPVDVPLYLGCHGDVREFRNTSTGQVYRINFHSGAGFIVSHSLAELLFARFPLETIAPSWHQFCQSVNNMSALPWCDVTFAYLVDQLELEVHPYQLFEGIYSCSYRGLYNNENNRCCPPPDLTKLVLGHFMEAPAIYECHDHYYPPPAVSSDRWTVVTGFFDLETYGQSRPRPLEFYLNAAKFIFSLDVNLVLYCDHKFVEEFSAARLAAGLADRSHVIGLDLRELDLFAYRDLIIANRLVRPCPDPRNNPTYCILTTAKFSLMERAIEAQYFPASTHFAWIDFGIQRTVNPSAHQVNRALRLHRDKFSACYIHYTPKQIVENLSEYYQWGRCGTAATFFTGDKYHMLKVAQLIKQEFIATVKAGYGHAEEQLMVPLALRHPELFDFYYGDYNEVVLNYDCQRVHPQITLNLILPPARSDNNFARSEDAAKKLYQAFRSNALYLGSSDLIRLLDEYFIAAFRLGQTETVKEILDYYVSQARLPVDEEVTGFGEEINRHLGHIIANTDHAIHYYPGERVEIWIDSPAHLFQALAEVKPDDRRYFITIDQGYTAAVTTGLINQNPVIRPASQRINTTYSTTIDLRWTPPVERNAGTTLVTAFFDLGRQEQTQRRSASDYLKHGQYVLSLDVNLIVFIEPEYFEMVREMRRNATGQTLIVSCPFESVGKWSQLDWGDGEKSTGEPEWSNVVTSSTEWSYHDQLERIIQCRQDNPVRNASGIKDTPLYMVVTWNKFRLLAEVARRNPFKSSHLGWLDFGITHVANTKFCLEDEIFTRPADRVRLLMMKPWQASDFQNEKDYFSGLRGYVAAGYIAGSMRSISRLSHLMTSSVQKYLAKGYAPSEEQILPLLGQDYPELFDYYYGDYAGILANYRQPRLCMNLIIYNLQNCRTASLFYRGCDVGSVTLEAIDGGFLKPSLQEFHLFLLEYYQLAFWFDLATAHQLAQRYAYLVQTNPSFAALFSPQAVTVRALFSFLGRDVFA